MGISQQLLTMLLLGATGDLSFQQLTLTREGLITAQRASRKLAVHRCQGHRKQAQEGQVQLKRRKQTTEEFPLIRSAA